MNNENKRKLYEMEETNGRQFWSGRDINRHLSLEL